MKLARWLADEVSMPTRDVEELARSAPFRYKVYEIPKRRGGKRTIAQPASEVKDLQRILVGFLQSRLPIHDAATAYMKGRGIRYNAAAHAQHSFILKLDFKNFFPSIQPHDFVSHWDACNAEKLSDADMQLLIRLLFWRPRGSQGMQLSIGAPSSPFLSNTVMYEIDCHISEYAKRGELSYTRYADDITLSSRSFESLVEAKEFVEQLLPRAAYPHLTLNADKTLLVSKKYQRRVTGLVLSNDGKVSLGRDRKRQIRAAIHRFCSNALEGQDIAMLQGLLAFALDVEPDFVDRMKAKYGKDTIATLLKRSNYGAGQKG